MNSSRSSLVSSSAMSASMLAEMRITSAFSSATAARNCSVWALPSSMLSMSTLQTYRIGLLVSSMRSFTTASPSSLVSKLRAGFSLSRWASRASPTSTIALASLSPLLAVRRNFSTRFSTVSMSFRISSVSMIILSRTGSTLPSTCTTLSSSKQRTTWRMASVSRILPRNWLPRPSPLLAPLMRPAISTMSTVVGITFCGFTSDSSLSRRGSGTVMTPRFGSLVAKG